MTDNECTICFLSVEPDFQHILQCGHIFHGACVGRWIEERGTCPNCRNWEVPPVGYFDDSQLLEAPEIISYTMSPEESARARQETLAAISQVPVTDVCLAGEMIECVVGGAAFTCPLRYVEIVEQQAELTRQQALVCLHRCNGDIVNAILEVYN